jgi:hypothetical protein
VVGGLTGQGKRRKINEVLWLKEPTVTEKKNPRVLITPLTQQRVITAEEGRALSAILAERKARRQAADQPASGRARSGADTRAKAPGAVSHVFLRKGMRGCATA